MHTDVQGTLMTIHDLAGGEKSLALQGEYCSRICFLFRKFVETISRFYLPPH